MVMWILILILLAIGLTLLVAEIVFIPGATVVGLLGLIFTAVAIYVTFKHFGSETGFYVLGGTGVVTVISLWYSFSSGAWTKFSLKDVSDSKVNEGQLDNLAPGLEGLTISALRPSGSAEFQLKTYEVRTTGAYVEPGQKVRISAINNNQVFVEVVE